MDFFIEVAVSFRAHSDLKALIKTAVWIVRKKPGIAVHQEMLDHTNLLVDGPCETE
jgi:hypothetical protein